MHGIIPSRWKMEAYVSGRSPCPFLGSTPRTPPQLIKVLMIITVYSMHLKFGPISNIFIDTCDHHIMVANENIHSQKFRATTCHGQLWETFEFV